MINISRGHAQELIGRGDAGNEVLVFEENDFFVKIDRFDINRTDRYFASATDVLRLQDKS